MFSLLMLLMLMLVLVVTVLLLLLATYLQAHQRSVPVKRRVVQRRPALCVTGVKRRTSVNECGGGGGVRLVGRVVQRGEPVLVHTCDLRRQGPRYFRPQALQASLHVVMPGRAALCLRYRGAQEAVAGAARTHGKAAAHGVHLDTARDGSAKTHQGGHRLSASTVCGNVQRGNAVPAGVDRHLACFYERDYGVGFVRGGGAVEALNTHGSAQTLELSRCLPSLKRFPALVRILHYIFRTSR